MKSLAHRALLAMFLVGASATSATAVMDDGSGCGCIRPCPLVQH